MPRAFVPVTPVQITTGGVNYNWRDINVRDFGVPIDATGVVLYVRNTHGGSRDYGIRCNGNTDNRNGGTNSGNWHTWAVVGIDADGILEFYNVAGFAQIQLFLVGYTLQAVDFSLSAVTAPDISPAAGAWAAVDLRAFGVPATAIGAIIEVYTSVNVLFGYRQNGSGDARTFTISVNHTNFCFVVGCDVNQIVELFRGAVNVRFYLHGYITDGVTFYLNAIDVTPGVLGAWTDFQLPMYGTMALLEISGVVGGRFGARQDAIIGPNEYRLTSTHDFAIPGAENRDYQTRIEFAGDTFHLIGYARHATGIVQTNPATEVT